MENIKEYVEANETFLRCDIPIVGAAQCEVGSNTRWYKAIAETILDLFLSEEYVPWPEWDGEEFMKSMMKMYCN